MTDQVLIPGFDINPFTEDYETRDLRNRYSFIKTITDKVLKQDVPAELFDKANRKYGENFLQSRVCSVPEQELDGFRSFIFYPYLFRKEGADKGLIDYTVLGVRADGIAIHRKRQTVVFAPGDTVRGAARKLQASMHSSLDVRRTQSPSGLHVLDEVPGLNPLGREWGKKAQEYASSQSNVIFEAGLRDIFSERGSSKKINQFDFIFQSLVAKREGRNLYYRVRDLLMSLDEDVRSRMFAHFDFSLGFANWVTGMDPVTRVISEQKKLYRAQALASYPLLKNVTTRDEITVQIDEGRSVEASILARFPEAKHIKRNLRRVTGLTWQRAGIDAYKDPLKHLEYLDAIDPRVTLRKKKDWVGAFAAVEYDQSYGYRNRPCSPDKILSKNNFETLHEVVKQVVEVSGGGGWEIRRFVADASKFIKFKLIAPLVAQRLKSEGWHSEEIYVALGTRTFMNSDGFEVLSRMSSTQALKFALDYHKKLLTLNDRTTDIKTFKDAGHVPPLLGTVEFKNGLVAREIGSLKGLRDQGEDQHHCVGGYFTQVLEGKSIIYSIETSEGKILSTVEVQPQDYESDKKENRFRITQNYAAGNRQPPKEAQMAASNLLRKLKALKPEETKQYVDQCKQVSRDISMQRIFSEVCFDPLDEEWTAIAFRQVQELLPSKLVKKLDLGLDEFVKMVPVPYSVMERQKELAEQQENDGLVNAPAMGM